jgi:hypothetical protein
MIQSFDLLGLTIALTPSLETASIEALICMILRCDMLGGLPPRGEVARRSIDLVGRNAPTCISMKQ